jgi:hypothetical protein
MSTAWRPSADRQRSSVAGVTMKGIANARAAGVGWRR